MMQKIETLKQLAPTVDGKKVFMLAPAAKGLKMVDAIKTANESKLVILPNKEFERRLSTPDILEKEKEAYDAWTGTFVAFSTDGKIGPCLEQELIVHCEETSRGKYKTTFRNIVLDGIPASFQGYDKLLAIDHGFKADGIPLIIPHGEGDRIVIEITDWNLVRCLNLWPEKTMGTMPPERCAWGFSINEKFGILGRRINLRDEVPLSKSVESVFPNARLNSFLRQFDGKAYISLIHRLARMPKFIAMNEHFEFAKGVLVRKLDE